jgi:cold shock CspA family protein
MAWKGGWGRKHPAPVIPEDYVVDKDARYPGTVINYYKWQGYGFIQPDQQGLVPADKVWVHWSNIQTEDRFPFLIKDQKVEFGLMKWTTGSKTAPTSSLRAKTVTEVGGEMIAVQDKVDGEKKEFLNGHQALRYTGTLKFYVPKMGYGYVAVDTEGAEFPEEMPKELRVEEPEVNCGGRRPTSFMENTPVEFGIVKNRKGQYMIYNMTMPGGNALTKAALEHRLSQGEQTYEGTISFFHWRQSWGLIVPDSLESLPPSVQQALKDQQQKSLEKAKAKESPEGEAQPPPEQALYFTKSDVLKGVSPKKDAKVTFQAYTDDKGAGAHSVAVVAVEDAA